jgi:hypothetical protein
MTPHGREIEASLSFFGAFENHCSLMSQRGHRMQPGGLWAGIQHASSAALLSNTTTAENVTRSVCGNRIT